MTPIVIFGAGGFGREVWSILAAINAVKQTYDVLGFVDDSLTEENAAMLARLQARHLGGSEWIESAPDDTQGVIAIGSPSARRAIDVRFAQFRWATLVHPDTTVGEDVRIAPGCVVAPGARLSTAISLGKHAHIDQNATVGHDSALGDFSRLNPQACVSGNVTVGAGATVGANATVLQGLNIGDETLIGAGAVVTRNIPASVTVKGIPAR